MADTMTTNAFLVFFVCLFISVPVQATAGETVLSPPRFFGTTDDVSLDVTPGIVYGGFTRDLTISCMFSKQQLSDFDVLQSLILSKAGASPDRYSELATITSVESDGVEIKQSLGAVVTGAITPNSQSFITYQWAWPMEEVGGDYFCEAHGTDVRGHARMSTAVGEVVIKETLDTGVISETMQELDSRLKNCSTDRALHLENIEILESSEEKLKKQLDESSLNAKSMAAILKDSVLLPGSSWRGHTYFLSKPVPTDIPIAHYFCVQLGGYLLEIDDKEERDFVAKLTDRLRKEYDINSFGVALGAWDRGHEGNWTYIRSEKPVTYFDWRLGEPNDYGGEDCVYLSASDEHQMNDIPCFWAVKKKISIMCEIPNILP